MLDPNDINDPNDLVSRELAEEICGLRKEIDQLYRLNDQLRDELRSRNMERTSGAPAIFDNSHVFKDMIDSLRRENETLRKERLPPLVHNSWTQENEETVKKWQLDIEKTSFVFGEILMDTSSKMNFILVTTLVMSVLNTLFAALSVTLSSLGVKWVGITFETLILICSAIAAILTGLLKIFGLDLRVQELTRYIEKLNNSWFLFEIELNISPDQRSNAHDFIKRADGQYLSLMQQSPSIDAEKYSKASRRYQERFLQDHLWSAKFKKHMQEEMKENEVIVEV